MSWRSVSLRRVAPPKPSSESFSDRARVWQLSLDQIEGGTGEIVGKTYGDARDAGNSTFAFDTGNVLYSKLRPYLNKVAIPDEPGIATTELIPLRPDKTVLDRKYLAYYLRSTGFVSQASHRVAGAKMPRVVMDWFWEHEIPLPPLSEQRRIVEILDQAYRLLKLRRDADAKSSHVLPALFSMMFGDPTTNPMKLRKKPLGEVIKVKSGEFLPTREMAGGEFPVYGGNGISGYHDKYMFEEAKIVLGRVGAYCGAVHYTNPKAWVTDNALYVSEKLENLDDLYLVAALKLANLNQYAGRAGQPLISGSRIYPIEILIPHEKEQQAFARYIQDLQSLDRRRLQLGQKLDRIWASLMQRAFSGQLTANWREAYMTELAAEMDQQARLLNLPPSNVERSVRHA